MRIRFQVDLYDLAIARQLEVFMDRILTVWAFYSVQPMDLLKMQTHSLIPPTIRNTGEKWSCQWEN